MDFNQALDALKRGEKVVAKKDGMLIYLSSGPVFDSNESLMREVNAASPSTPDKVTITGNIQTEIDGIMICGRIVGQAESWEMAE